MKYLHICPHIPPLTTGLQDAPGALGGYNQELDIIQKPAIQVRTARETFEAQGAAAAATSSGDRENVSLSMDHLLILKPSLTGTVLNNVVIESH